jgi:2-keto-4-pentenoate hydratase/2-oxohepta-3-ene-1,7-dioic acid hydratase in catechol pathway
MRNSAKCREEWVVRKSFSTFAPLGPYLLTADEVADPTDLELRLSVNGDERQHAALADLIVDIPGLIEHASSVFCLQPGDVFATGTPAGVGPIVPGDEVEFSVDGIGTMRLPVVNRSW